MGGLDPGGGWGSEGRGWALLLDSCCLKGFGTGKILLPSARHLEEGRGTTIFELPRLENCISRLCPRPLGSPPPPNTQIV